MRFGYVYKVPILQVNHAHVEETVRETITEAARKAKPSKRCLVCRINNL